MEKKQSKEKAKFIDRWSFLWLIVGASLLLFSNGRWIIPLATWLAPIFLLRFTRTQKSSLGLILLLVIYVVVFIISWVGMIPLEGIFYYLVSGGFGLLYWLPYLADRLLVRRLPGFLYTLIFPLVYVIVEYISALTNPYGSWGLLGYTQHSFLPFIQLVSVTGMWGLTFLITWLAPLINWAWEREFEWLNIRKGLITYAGVLILVLLFGGGRLALLPPQSNTIQIASLVQTDDFLEFLDMEGALASRDHFTEIGNLMLEKSRQQAQSGADIIIWQEGAIPVFPEDESTFLEQARTLAQQEEIYLLVGLVTLTEQFPDVPADNQAIWITPDGDVKWEYLKGRPVPGEPVVAGDGIIPIDQTIHGDISSVICFDMDFPTYMRQAGQIGTDIMLVPSWDWREIDPLHTHMASFRGIEHGFSLVRATGDGLSAAFDYQGRVLSTADYFTTDRAMVSHLPTKGVSTIYTAVGDLFAWLGIASFAGLLGLALLKRKPNIE